MEERNKSGLFRCALLGGEDSGLRGSSAFGSGWKPEEAYRQSPGDPGRVPCEMERRQPGQVLDGRLVPARVHQRVERWPDSRQQADALDGSGREGLDEELGWDGTPRGRVRKPKEKRRRVGGRDEEEEGTPSGCKLQLREQKEEEEEEVKETKEGCPRGEGRDKEGSGHQGAVSSLRQDWFGSQRSGKKTDDEEGKEGCQEEEQEGQQLYIGELGLRGHRQSRGREQWHLRRGGPHQDGVEPHTGCADHADSESDADVPGSSEWAAMGAQPISCPSNIFPILEDVPVWQGDRANEPGDPIDLLRPGSSSSGQGCPSVRRVDAEIEEFGANSRRRRLQDISTARACTFGSSQPVEPCRDVGCVEASSRGAEGKASGEPALGSPWKRRLRLLGCPRKGQRQGPQRERRQGAEGRLEQERRQGRQGSERQREGLIDLGSKELRSEAEKRRRGREFHCRVDQGRGNEPTQSPPLVRGLHANEMPGLLGSEGQSRSKEACTDEAFLRSSASAGVQLLEVQRETGQKRPAEDLRGGHPLLLEGMSFGEVVPMMLVWFQKCLVCANLKHSKVQTSGGIFPLPEQPSGLVYLGITLAEDVQNVLLALCCAMNSYYGVQKLDRFVPSKVRTAALRSMAKYAETVCAWSEKFASDSWEELLHTRSVDYKGEEVKVAKGFQWENIQPALPGQVGEILLEDVCELGTLSYITKFEEYLLPLEAQVYTKPPKVMVQDEAWPHVCAGLVQHGICEVMPLREVYHLRGRPVLNGLFGVSKDEFSGTWEVYRLIMNLVPVNKLCRNLGGDVCTLPNWSGMTAYLMEENEVTLMSSEDIRCFFYLFQIPKVWRRYMGFNMMVPEDQVPSSLRGLPCVLVSRVLPMGFLNSVAIAQHIHRRVARAALHNSLVGLGPQQEIRRDRPLPSASVVYRIYLDNFDILERMDANLAGAIKGETSVFTLSLRQQYGVLGMPRHPKKAVQRQDEAEIQGAWFNGVTGRVTPKPSKVLKYVGLGLKLLESNKATQKQLQIVCGGFVYCCMFRRALLGLLNAVWKFIVSFEGEPPFIAKQLPPLVRLEIIRFICATPLAQMNLSSPFREDITASDASEHGGGFCVSKGLTALGSYAASCPVRGDVPEAEDCVMVLTVGLFDGIAALRVAADSLSLPMSGHVSCEVSKEGNRVVESHFPDSTFVGRVEDIDEDTVRSWACQHTNVGVVVVGGGPPCQGVSGLNVDRKGALKDARSSLFPHVRRVFVHCKTCFPWAQVHYLMESVWSMDASDRAIMSESIGSCPYVVDSFGAALCRRPRVYWVSWEVSSAVGVEVEDTEGEGWFAFTRVNLSAELDEADFMAPGAKLEGQEGLPTFTTSRPRERPGPRPAGLWQCTAEEVNRWQRDDHRYPPYQYRTKHLIRDASGELRLPSISEKEVIMGFPLHYTAACMPKSQQVGTKYWDCRHSLIGNSWNVTVVAWLLSQLFHPLGLTSFGSLSQVVSQTSPGRSNTLRGFLQRLPLRRVTSSPNPNNENAPLILARKLASFVSIKGEDILLQAPSEGNIRFHRLRASVPANLWQWRIVTGWGWRHSNAHINELELRAVLTTLSWRLQRKRHLECRFIHLVDSLVVLHCLSRGRSSSRKLRRVLSQINALLLCADVHPVWAYVSTKQNPADRPSRQVRRHAEKRSKN